MGILLRWLGAFLLLAATFNPTQWNFVRWAEANWQTQMPLTVLFGLILAIGIVVDDAIMVLENIYRHQALGKNAHDSAKDGAEHEGALPPLVDA